MERTLRTLLMASLAVLWASTANAAAISGDVLCDVDGDGTISAGDLPQAGVTILIENLDGTFSASVATDENGDFRLDLPNVEDSYTVEVDLSSLPAGTTSTVPGSGIYVVEINRDNPLADRSFLVNNPECSPPGEDPGACWMTGGGAKFEAVVDGMMAQHGPKDSLGGNVYPGCSPTAGQGGQWNHVAHSLKLHFQGFTVDEVECGNVPGIEPGSESPVTPFNYIEFSGTGRIKGIKGSKVPSSDVLFFGRVEDRNEPGSNGQRDGAEKDRYFLHVFSDSGDPVGSTQLLVDMDGDATTIDPIVITDGNLQLHISSCDDPPVF